MTKAHFNEHASEYDQHAQIQAIIADKLIAKTTLKSAPQNILELGCGTAYISNQLHQHYPKAKFHLCDNSTQMLEQAQLKCGHRNFTYEQCSFPKQAHKYDLIISSMALQWFDQLPETLKLCKAALNPLGTMSFAMPIEDTLKLLPEVFEELGFNFNGINYWNEEKLTQICQDIFGASAIEVNTEIQSFDQSIDFLRNLHHIGANFNHQLNTAQVRKILKAMDSRRLENKLHAEYRILNLISKAHG